MKSVVTRCLFFLSAVAGISYNSFAQADLPKIVKPSPEVSALFRFQDYPMDYSTGLPQISIPIYEVQSGSLSVPISISYHASGRKVYDQDGPIALGWSLNAGGVISRTIYGSADFGTPVKGTYNFPYPFVIDNLTNLNDLKYLQKIFHCDIGDCSPMPYTDSEFDIFSYSIGSSSGKFFFKDNNGVKTPVTLPYKPLTITPAYDVWGLNTISIVDDLGTIYQFNAGESYSLGSNNATSSWLLSKMISADKTDTISFAYSGGSELRTTISQAATLIDDWYMDLEPFPIDNLTYGESTTQEDYQISRLSSITFKQGKVVFNLVSGTYKIDNIQVLNLKNEVLKTIKFNRSLCYSQAELGYANNKLDGINFRDKSNNNIENYSFEYYPVISSDGQMNVRYCDWWGYYNNSGQHDMVPRYTNLTYIGSGGPGSIDVGNSLANRAPSLEPMKSGVLKKITYPTGGTSEFVYELNKCTLFGGGGGVVDGPGLRIYQIKNADNNGGLNVKTYKYGINESGSGNIELLPDITSMATESIVAYMGGPQSWWDPDRAGKYRQRVFYSGFTGELNALADRPVIYTEVAEYTGTEAINSGKAIYKYDFNSWSASGMPMLMSLTIPRKHIYNFNYWNNPSLILKTDYKRVNIGTSPSYVKIKEASNNYTSTTTETVRGLHVQRVCSIPQTGVGSAMVGGIVTAVCSEEYSIHEQADNLLPVPAQIYTFSGYEIPVGYKNLASTSETVYGDDGSVISSTASYQYNSKQLLNKTTRTLSDGNPLVTDVKYPTDYTGNTTLDLMVSLNMINYPVEQIETNNSVHRKSVKTNYFNWGTTPAKIYPQTVDLKNGPGSYETRLRYSAYDTEGNPLTVSKESDQLISYVWGYNNTYPIAEVNNTAVKNIFHTSFEDATGNSTLNDCKTGRLSKTGGFTKALSSLDNGSYVLTYWQKSGSVWTLQTTAVTVSAGTYTISLTGQVDEVRFYPKTSQMKTYTYDPLIGILSQCDASDHVSYYEYDDFGRLKLIRDMNGNILKTFKYQYQQTPLN